jgi:hypothetical protein
MPSLCGGPTGFGGLLQPPAVNVFPVSSAGKRSAGPNWRSCRLTFPTDINGPAGSDPTRTNVDVWPWEETADKSRQHEVLKPVVARQQHGTIVR